MKKGIFIIFIFFSNVVFAVETNDVLIQSRDLVSKQQWQQALNLLHNAEKQHPEDVDIQLAIARIYVWQGKYKEAKQKIHTIPHVQANSEAQLLKGNIEIYEENYSTAKIIFENIIDTFPNNTEAKTALIRVNKILDELNTWKISSGVEQSDFSRRDQSSWNQAYINLAKTFNEGKTTTHTQITRYDQFEKVDTEFEVGVNHQFSSEVSFYTYGSFTSDSNFRPEYRLGVGGSRFLLNFKKWSFWSLLDTRFNVYEDSEVYNINPGISVYLSPRWVLSNNIISVFQSSEEAVFGWSTRLDGPFFRETNFYLGYADAPETVAAFTVDTQTVFGGIAYPVNSKFILNLGYTRDDREDSYIRQVYNVSFRYTL